MQRIRVTSGVDRLDDLLDGLYIGDNVVWYDDAGSLAAVFCDSFIRTSLAQEKHLIYVSFDRSPRNLIARLGPLAQSAHLILLDCFTFGKGAGSDIFLKFYREGGPEAGCRLVRVDQPLDMQAVMSVLYGIHATLPGDVRLVFESVTGMQGLWGGEEEIVRFYSQSCPRLYELNTIAYWLMEKKAHSQALKARINQVAQVAIDLAVRRGNTSLTVLKAEGRDVQTLNQPFFYRVEENRVALASRRGAADRIDLGSRLKDLRTTRGFSQNPSRRGYRLPAGRHPAVQGRRGRSHGPGRRCHLPHRGVARGVGEPGAGAGAAGVGQNLTLSGHGRRRSKRKSAGGRRRSPGLPAEPAVRRR